MKRFLLAVAPLAVVSPAYATTYLTVEQAQAAIFPGAAMTPDPRTLTPDQAKAIAKAAGVKPLSPALKAWKVAAADGKSAGWFIVDEVVGKHEFITFAVGIDAAGAVRGIEILDYREVYGGEVRAPAWRAQFTGKTAASAMVLDHDIRNISGATLSSRHVTDGVKRLLVTAQLVLAPKG
ncbi:MAG: FMN-binding protein [Sphingomonadaceae bacterium]|nr:FMN-binding protein [Sphingomonadaceae bacterium]